MLHYALLFFIIAIVAGYMGFGRVASASTDIARLLFFFFVVLVILSLIGHVFGIAL